MFYFSPLFASFFCLSKIDYEDSKQNFIWSVGDLRVVRFKLLDMSGIRAL